MVGRILFSIFPNEESDANPDFSNIQKNMILCYYDIKVRTLIVGFLCDYSCRPLAMLEQSFLKCVDVFTIFR